jgi:hypothetical protein
LVEFVRHLTRFDAGGTFSGGRFVDFVMFSGDSRVDMMSEPHGNRRAFSASRLRRSAHYQNGKIRPTPIA